MKNAEKKTISIKTKYGTYNVSIWFDSKDKTYLVKALGLPNVVTFGTSLADAKRMAKDAIELYYDCVVKKSVAIDYQNRITGKIPQSRVASMVK